MYFIEQLRSKGTTIIIGMLLLFFITDSLNAIIRYAKEIGDFLFFTPYLRLSAYTRGLTWGLLVLFFIYRYHRRLFFWGIIIVISIMFSLSFSLLNSEAILPWSIQLAKLTFPFLLWDLMNFFQSPQLLRRVLPVFVSIIIVQVGVVLISFALGADFLLSYNENRFGYSGLIMARNEIALFYLLAGVLFLRFWQKTGNLNYIFGFLLISFSAILLGAKAGLLVFFSLTSFLVFQSPQKKRRSFILVGAVMSFLLAIGLYLSGYFDFFIRFYQNDGWLIMLTSMRSQLFTERVLPLLEQWSFFNYLFGGVNPATSFVEMDIVDLFLFGGIIGSLAYYWHLFKTLFNFKKDNIIAWFLVIMYFFIGGLAGHVFASGVNALYLVITCYYLQQGPQIILSKPGFPP